MDPYDGSSEQSRCDIVATSSSALSSRDLPPLQLKVNLPLQQVEPDQMQTDERSQHSEELSVDKDTLRPRARAPSPWHSTLVPRHESIRGPLASAMMSSTASALSKLITKPSALAAVPFNLGMPQTPERAYLTLARAMAIQALDTVLASRVSH